LYKDIHEEGTFNYKRVKNSATVYVFVVPQVLQEEDAVLEAKSSIFLEFKRCLRTEMLCSCQHWFDGPIWELGSEKQINPGDNMLGLSGISRGKTGNNHFWEQALDCSPIFPTPHFCILYSTGFDFATESTVMWKREDKVVNKISSISRLKRILSKGKLGNFFVKEFCQWEIGPLVKPLKVLVSQGKCHCFVNSISLMVALETQL